MTFLARRGGLAPGMKEVPRGEATHARIALRGLDGKTRDREVERAEAERFLGEVERMHAAAAAWTARGESGREERARERLAAAAQVDLTCRHCGIPREYEGRRNLVSSGAPDHLAREDQFQLSRPESRAYEEYACPRCGSVELFRSGRLDHPLAGGGT